MVVFRRPGIAARLEAGLQDRPGIKLASASPVTGRLLILHDSSLSDVELGRLVAQAVTSAASQTDTALELYEGGPGAAPARFRQRGYVAPLLLAGGAAVAVALGSSLLGSPVVRLAAVLLATAIVVRRAWRRSKSRTQPHSGAVSLSNRRALSLMVGAHRGRFYLASSLSVVGQVLFLTPAFVIGYMLAILTAGPSTALAALGLATAAGQMGFLAAAMAVIMAGSAVVSFASGVLWRDLAQLVCHEWRTEMYGHVQRTEVRCLDGERTNSLARVLTSDIDEMGRFIANAASDLVQLGTTFLVLVPVFLVTAPGLAWIVFLPVPFIAWLSFFYQERVASRYASVSGSGSLLNSQLVNNLEATATIKSFGTEDYEIARINRLSEAYRESNHLVDLRSVAYSQTVQVSAITSLIGILLFGGFGVLNGTLSFEVYNGLIGLPYFLLGRLPLLGGAVEQYQRSVSAVGRVIELRDLPVESDTTGASLDIAAVKGDLVLEAVTFAYPGRSPVLQDMSLRIAAKKTTGIVGVTGAGKTTIAKLLLRLQEVGSGRVMLDGVDVRDVRLKDLRAAIGFVTQDAFLFDGTVWDNICYGTFDAGPDCVAAAARLAKAEDFVEALPQRYDTLVGERGATLSGGQRQRISLARAIVKAAPILVLDEATSAVDNETEAAIQRSLAEFASDRTLVIIAHRLSTIRHADWIYVMGVGGTVVEQGAHEDLLERDGIYASLWRLQIGEAM